MPGVQIMPRGVFPNGRKVGTSEDVERLEALEKYNAHRREMKGLGHDPDYIGVTEVAPVCCQGCGAPIPWGTLRTR
jgi:hypothetical protein